MRVPRSRVLTRAAQITLSFAQFAALRVLDLSGNRLRFPRQLAAALLAPVLEQLDLRGNPMARELAGYRAHVLAHSASLRLARLDDAPVSPDERCAAWLEHEVRAAPQQRNAPPPKAYLKLT